MQFQEQLKNSTIRTTENVKVFARNRYHRERSKLEYYCTKIVKNVAFSIIVYVALFMALFFPDIWIIADVGDTTSLDIILTIVFVIFILELFIRSYGEKGYYLRFFFWMDVIGTFSLLLDLNWAFGTYDQKSTFDKSVNSNVALLRAARTAKLGARAGRLSRVMRLMKYLPSFYRSRREVPGVNKTARRLSMKLTNTLAIRIALLCILLVIAVPLFSILEFPDTDYSMQVWMIFIDITYHHLDHVFIDSVFSNQISLFKEFYENKNYYPYLIEVYELYRINNGTNHQHSNNGTTTFIRRELGSIPNRVDNILLVENDPSFVNELHDNILATSYFNFTETNRISAIFNMCLIIFVISIMIISAMLLTNAISDIIMRPLERLLDRVSVLSKSIFSTVEDLKRSTIDQSPQDINGYIDDDDDNDLFSENDDNFDEADVLEKIVEKLAILYELSMGGPSGIDRSKMNREELGVMNMMTGTNEALRSSAENREKFNVFLSTYPNSGNSSLEIAEDSGDMPDRPVTDPVIRDAGILTMSTLFHPGCYNSLKFSAEVNMHVLLSVFTHSDIALKSYRFVTKSSDRSSLIMANKTTLMSFFAMCNELYLDNPYHNFSHAVDVTHTIAHFMSLCDAHLWLRPIDTYALLIASVGHDISHPGQNNPFLVQTRNILALEYNDVSPLENMHAAKLFAICAKDEKCNVFENLDESDFREVRKTIITSILHTDNAVHFTMVKDLSVFYEMNSDKIDSIPDVNTLHRPLLSLYSDDGNRPLFCNLLLHAADISNPAKPFDVCKEWAILILEEFFRQGDLEKKMNIPVQMLNDRETVVLPSSQVGFIEFLVAPLYVKFVTLFPKLHSFYGNNMCDNVRLWAEEAIANGHVEEDKVDAMLNRVHKLRQNFEDIPFFSSRKKLSNQGSAVKPSRFSLRHQASARVTPG